MALLIFPPSSISFSKAIQVLCAKQTAALKLQLVDFPSLEVEFLESRPSSDRKPLPTTRLPPVLKITQCLLNRYKNSLLYMILQRLSSVITSKAANDYHFKTGQRDWPSRTENVLPCRLLWWQVGFGAPASRAALEHVAVVQ